MSEPAVEQAQARGAGDADAGARHPGVFVMGSPRSGTSVLAWALAAHPEIETGPEADFFYLVNAQGRIREAYAQARRREDGWLAQAGVGLEEFMAAVGVGLDALYRRHAGGKRWVDSTPSNVMVCSDLALMFPHAKFLHVIRDGRAAVASMQNSGFDAAVARDFEVACRTWALYVEWGHAFAEKMPDRCLEVRQEHLLTDPEGTMERVQRFLGVEPAPGVAAYLRANRLNSSYAPREGANNKPLAGGQTPAKPWSSWGDEQRELFLKHAQAMMETMGYPTDLG